MALVRFSCNALDRLRSCSGWNRCLRIEPKGFEDPIDLGILFSVLISRVCNSTFG